MFPKSMQISRLRSQPGCEFQSGENYVIASQFDTSPKKDGEPEKRWGWTVEVNAFNAAPPVPSIRLQGKQREIH